MPIKPTQIHSLEIEPNASKACRHAPGKAIPKLARKDRVNLGDPLAVKNLKATDHFRKEIFRKELLSDKLREESGRQVIPSS